MDYRSYLCVTVVRIPGGSEALLATDIPDEEACLANTDLLNIAANCGRGLDGLLCQAGSVGKQENMLDSILTYYSLARRDTKYQINKSCMTYN